MSLRPARSRSLLTDAQIKAQRPPNYRVSEPAGESLRGGGSLCVVWRGGFTRHFVFRYGVNRREVFIGPYAERGEGGVSLLDARRKARQLSQRYRDLASQGRDLRDVIEADHVAARAAEVEAAESARRRAEMVAGGSLARLLEAYCTHLETQAELRSAPAKKATARDVRSLFRLHVITPWPTLADKLAADVTRREVTGVLRRLTEAGKGRTAAKLRTYIGAAFSLAQRAEHDASAPASLLVFGIESNPVSGTASLSQFNRAGDRALNAAELGAFMRVLDQIEVTPASDAVRLALLLGGQRPTQLLRLEPDDVDLYERCITLRDPKGRRAQPRIHLLPLVSETSLAIVKRQLEQANALARGRDETREKANFVFTHDGLRGIATQTLSEVVHRLGQLMTQDPSLTRAGAPIKPFAMRDLRRTVETHMASIGVPMEVRGQIQSHGLGGVQARHYDRHDWAVEKRRALAAWDAYLTGLKAEVENSLAATAGGRWSAR